VEPTVYRAQGALARFVDYFWTFDSRPGDTNRTLKMFATGVSGVLFQHHEGQPALGATPDGHPAGRGGCPTSFVYGKRTRPTRTFANGPFALTGVVLKPQGLNTLFKIEPASLSDGSARLNEFCRENIADQLLNAASSHERIVILRRFLRQRAETAASDDLLVAESLQLIRQRLPSIKVRHLLKALHVSERQFERRFSRAIGVSPHHYIRIVRFRKAMRLMKAHQFHRLSDLAYDLSYVDQSHFIKDSKAFSGCTPGRLVHTVRSGVELPCAFVLAPADA